jgi:tetratricopeptide (TPR) repeat protein
MVESVELPVPLCRDFVPELIRVVERGGDEAGVSWNVVESLELLLDAGAFKDALALATSVVAMLGEDKRNRLFQAYVELCNLVQGAPFSAALEKIEGLAIEIEHGGFSPNDRCWSVIVVARAIEVGVYSRALPESELFRARTLLSGVFSNCASTTTPEMRIKVGVELARSYVHCPTPEFLAAREIVGRLLSMCESLNVTPELVFDVSRLMHQLGGEEAYPSERLRELARPLGGVARGLTELAIARSESQMTPSAVSFLEKALTLFEESSYRSGEFEALIALGTASADCDHHAKAYRLFCRADQVASAGGFLYGRGVALLGLFHSALGSGEVENAAIGAEKLRLLCGSDIFISAFGLNVVAAHQLLGKSDTASKIAMKCEKLFASHGLHSSTAQAAFMLGASYADAGKWKQARAAWKRALTCDELRRAYISACDRRAALAQATAMVDFIDSGELREATLVEIEGLLARSEEALHPFGQSTQALQALGKTLHIHAQLAILAMRPMNALKYLNRARECFGTIELAREVALTDGLIGLALLEASKQNGAQLLDEAMGALQRSLDFFVQSEQVRITWKIRYYLAVACVLKSQQTSDPLHREAHRRMAAGFLEDASGDATSFDAPLGMARASAGEGDFSPGLTPQVLEPLRKVLGLRRRGRKGRSAEKRPLSPQSKYGRFVH